MAKTNQDIPDTGDQITAGDTIVIKDTVNKEDGSAYDLTGAKVSFFLGDYPGDPTPHVEKDSDGSDVTITSAVNGQVKVTLNPSDTEDLGDWEGEDYFYRIRVEASGGAEATVTTGHITLYA